jgi:hypothetical protein
MPWVFPRWVKLPEISISAPAYRPPSQAPSSEWLTDQIFSNDLILPLNGRHGEAGVARSARCAMTTLGGASPGMPAVLGSLAFTSCSDGGASDDGEWIDSQPSREMPRHPIARRASRELRRLRILMLQVFGETHLNDNKAQPRKTIK